MKTDYADEQMPLAERLIKIPTDTLNPNTLQAIIEEFVTREGTDYGDKSFSLSEKVASVGQRLNNNEAILLYDNLTETIDIVSGAVMEKLLNEVGD